MTYFKVGLPTFWDKVTEVPSLSWNKGKAQNVAKGQNGPGQHVKIWDGMLDETVPDFDSLSRPAGENGTEQKRTF